VSNCLCIHVYLHFLVLGKFFCIHFQLHVLKTMLGEGLLYEEVLINP